MALPPQFSGRRLMHLIKVVIDAIGFVASILTIATIFTTTILAILATLSHQQRLIIPIVFFALGILVTIIILAVSNLIFARTIPGRWIVRGYRWVSAEYIYCIEDFDLAEHSQELKIEIMPTRSGVNIFENKYSASGHPIQENLEVLSPGHELMGSITRQRSYYPFNRWKYYYIYLGHEVPQENNVEVRIKQTVHYDQNGAFEPFLAKNITEPIKSLKLRVLILETVHLQNAYNYELNHAGPHNQIINRIPCSINIIRHNGQLFQELSYELPKPRFNHRYEIRWEW
jgi:hypothetical protein